MTTFNSTLQERVLIICKQDMNSLYDRLHKRQREYVSILVGKRTRDHFELIFKNKYEALGPDLLVQIPAEVLKVLDSFYKEVDELRWYFYHTEDMGATIQDILRQKLKYLQTVLDLANAEIEKVLFNLGQTALEMKMDAEEDCPPPPPPFGEK